MAYGNRKLRIYWRAIDFASGIVTVGADIAKTASRRTVEDTLQRKCLAGALRERIGGFGPFFSTRTAVNTAQAGRETTVHGPIMRFGVAQSATAWL